MNMRHPNTQTAKPADLFGHMEHLIAQLDSPPTARTAKLTASSTKKKARKLVEEATEVAFDALSGNRDGLIAESVDLLYHLAVLWHDRGIDPSEVRAEMARRMAVLGISEKLPKKGPAKKLLKRSAQPCALYRQGDKIGPVTLSGALR
jgi:phosphoribosyl-ATP pyrophosphohydrolase